MVKLHEEQTAKLEQAAAKGAKFRGIANMQLSSKLALGVLVVVALLSILAPLIAPYGPTEIFTSRQAPGAGFI